VGAEIGCCTRCGTIRVNVDVAEVVAESRLELRARGRGQSLAGLRAQETMDRAVADRLVEILDTTARVSRPL
jgi:hypothetical protein